MKEVKENLILLQYPEFIYVDTAFGGPQYRNNVCRMNRIEIPKNTTDCFASMFRFKSEYESNYRSIHSVSGAKFLECYSDFLWFDIDSFNLEKAIRNARQLAINIELLDRDVSEDISILFSGAKGFHIGLPSALFGTEPLVELPLVHKVLAELISKDVSIDTAIYESNRLWRIPNTKNGKSGLYKVPLTFDQLATLSIEEIKELAKNPLGKPYIYLVEQGKFKPSENLCQLYRQAISEISSPNRGISSNGNSDSSHWLTDDRHCFADAHIKVRAQSFCI